MTVGQLRKPEFQELKELKLHPMSTNSASFIRFLI